MRRLSVVIALSVLGATVFSPRVAGADKAKVVMIPLGHGAALPITTKLVEELAKKEAARGASQVEVSYPLEPRTAYKPSRTLRKADKLTRQAQKLLLNFDFAKVRTRAHAALKIYKHEMRQGASSKGYVEALHLMAAAELLDGNEKDAFKWMNDATLWDRHAPDKRRFSPDVQSFHNRVLSNTEHKGWIQFSVKPDALVFFNRKLQGLARGRVEKRAGLYLVRIALPGRLTWERWLRIPEGQTKELTLELKVGPAKEPPVVAALRAEVQGDKPGSSTLLLASDHGADEIVLVDAETPCSEKKCPVKLRWGRGSKWLRKAEGTYTGDAEQVASAWLGLGARVKQHVAEKRPKDPVPDRNRCVDDAQCFSDYRCVEGTCQKVVPLTRKWWFWTLVGVGIAGVVTAITIPLAQPSAPVIEVR